MLQSLVKHAITSTVERDHLNIAVMLLIAITLLPVNFVRADSSVWKVSKGDAHVYVGGTLHMLSEQDYPLPAEFTEAYEASALVVFETDIVKISQPRFQREMMSTMIYSDGSSVRDHLQRETLELLEGHFQERGIPFEQFVQYKPSMLSLLISMIELQVLGITSRGVDQYFSSMATDDGKAQLALETPQQQMKMIATMAGDKPDRLIRHTIRDVGDMRAIMSELVAAWRIGDVDQLESDMIEKMKADYPNVYKNLLVTRNNNWLPVILSLFDTDEVEFVLVGAGHLVGEDGLLELLEIQGYTVESM